MTKFHEGQEVEVADIHTDFGVWRKAKIVARIVDPRMLHEVREYKYKVLFPNGTSVIFDEEHIREVKRS